MRSVVILVLLTNCICTSAKYVMRKSGVYVTVSSFTDVFNSGQFEVNWFGIPEKYFGKAYIALVNNSLPKFTIIEMQLIREANGKFTSRVTAPEFQVEDLMKGKCLGYGAALLQRVRKGEFRAIYSRCFSPRPKWMRKNCSILSRLKLKQMLIPGTHNSGMYNLGYALPHELLYVYNQDQTIKQQLLYGIRGLDLRVQYYNNEFYITHNTYRGWVIIKQVLEDVRWFVNETGELVLMDFHRFATGFEEEHKVQRHTELQKLIVEELQDVLIDDNQWKQTIGEIFDNCKAGSKKGHVIVFYNGMLTWQYQKYLSLSVMQKWPNAQSAEALKTYLETEACECHSSHMCGIMAELTSSFPYLIDGNRIAAEVINRMVTEFFRQNFDCCPAIVYTDYFLGNGMIDVAIEANLVIASAN